MNWFVDLFSNFSAGMALLWDGIVAGILRLLGGSMIPMLLFVFIALLGFFHVISVQTTAYGFLTWFVVMFIYSEIRDPRKKRSIFEERAEPDLENAFPLGRSHVMRVRSPYGHSFTIGASVPGNEMSYEEFARDIREYRALMERTKIGNEWQGKSDESYNEPMACYPMEMRHE